MRHPDCTTRTAALRVGDVHSSLCQSSMQPLCEPSTTLDFGSHRNDDMGDRKHDVKLFLRY